MPTFVLVKLGPSLPSCWWEKRGDRLFNEYGGNHSLSKHHTIQETVECDDWNGLDYKKTGLNDPASDTGWLAPNGDFYGCPPYEHDSYSDRILGRPVRELEAAGYVRVVKRAEHDKRDYLGGDKFITQAQEDWLEARGYAT